MDAKKSYNIDACGLGRVEPRNIYTIIENVDTYDEKYNMLPIIN